MHNQSLIFFMYCFIKSRITMVSQQKVNFLIPNSRQVKHKQQEKIKLVTETPKKAATSARGGGGNKIHILS